MHLSKRIFQNIIKIAKYQTFSKLAVLHPFPQFTRKPVKDTFFFQIQNNEGALHFENLNFIGVTVMVICYLLSESIKRIEKMEHMGSMSNTFNHLLYSR